MTKVKVVAALDCQERWVVYYSRPTNFVKEKTGLREKEKEKMGSKTILVRTRVFGAALVSAGCTGVALDHGFSTKFAPPCTQVDGRVKRNTRI